MKSLTEIRFQDLLMKTANHRYILLYYYTEFKFEATNIIRTIKCFIASKLITTIESNKMKYFSLILEILWLYLVNTYISI